MIQNNEAEELPGHHAWRRSAPCWFGLCISRHTSNDNQIMAPEPSSSNLKEMHNMATKEIMFKVIFGDLHVDHYQILLDQY